MSPNFVTLIIFCYSSIPTRALKHLHQRCIALTVGVFRVSSGDALLTSVWNSTPEAVVHCARAMDPCSIIESAGMGM